MTTKAKTKASKKAAKKIDLATQLKLAQSTIQFMSQKLQHEIELRLELEKKAVAEGGAVGDELGSWRVAANKGTDRRETILQYDNRREGTAAGASTNPKVLMGQAKVPMLSVIPPASLIHQGIAMRYGAHLAIRADGKRGYGPYNWRDQPIEGHIYVDAAMRHLLQYQDGEDYEFIYDEEDKLLTNVHNLGFALATIGILLDAIENETVIDDRPKVRSRVASRLLDEFKIQKRNAHDFEPKK